jgi:hypothetical protein
MTDKTHRTLNTPDAVRLGTVYNPVAAGRVGRFSCPCIPCGCGGRFVFEEYRREGKSGGRDEFCEAKKRSKPTLVLVQAATQYDPYDTTDYHAEDAFENYHVRRILSNWFLAEQEGHLGDSCKEKPGGETAPCLNK